MPLERATQLNMLGDPDSCGIWAPCLSYADGLFYLVYTDVKRYGRSTAGPNTGVMFRDMHNYLVTGTSVEGEWSEPVHLNSRSEEHTSELQSLRHLVCRLLLE